MYGIFFVLLCIYPYSIFFIFYESVQTDLMSGFYILLFSVWIVSAAPSCVSLIIMSLVYTIIPTSLLSFIYKKELHYWSQFLLSIDYFNIYRILSMYCSVQLQKYLDVWKISSKILDGT